MLIETQQDSIICPVTQKMAEQEFVPMRNDCGAWMHYIKGGTFVLHCITLSPWARHS